MHLCESAVRIGTAAPPKRALLVLVDLVGLEPVNMSPDEVIQPMLPHVFHNVLRSGARGWSEWVVHARLLLHFGHSGTQQLLKFAYNAVYIFFLDV